MKLVLLAFIASMMMRSARAQTVDQQSLIGYLLTAFYYDQHCPVLTADRDVGLKLLDEAGLSPAALDASGEFSQFLMLRSSMIADRVKDLTPMQACTAGLHNFGPKGVTVKNLMKAG